MKKDFKPFKIGTVFNPLKVKICNNKPLLEEITIDYPSRLNAMAIDPSKIASNNNLVYTPGEIVFPVKIYRKIHVKVTNTPDLIISDRSKRKSLIKHAFLLMKKAIGFKESMYIDVDNSKEIKHVGLGSSSALISGVASAINEVYGKPIQKQDLIQYLAQNHGEEVENSEDIIMPVQCIGGTAASGINGGGLIILCGNSCVIKTMEIPSDYSVIIGIPKDFTPPDSKEALEKELENIHGFIECGKKYGPTIAYEILHKCLPAMVKGDLKTIGDVIYSYRYNMGSVKNCSFLYPKLVKLMNDLAPLKKNKLADVLSVSSVGPGIFAITKKPNVCISSFKKEGLKVYKTKIENEGYRVIMKVAEKKFWNSKEQVTFFRNKPPCKYVVSNLKKIKLPKTQRVLDLGCGGGRHTELLASIGFDTYGIDYNECMLKTCKKRLLKFYNKKGVNKRIKKASMLKLPFPNDYFNIIISTGVFHQAKSLEEFKLAVKEASRVLKKGGILVTNILSSRIMDPTYMHLNNGTVITKEGVYMTLISKKQYINIMAKHGFKVKGRIIEDLKDVGTGPRCVLRITFKKNENLKK